MSRKRLVSSAALLVALVLWVAPVLRHQSRRQWDTTKRLSDAGPDASASAAIPRAPMAAHHYGSSQPGNLHTTDNFIDGQVTSTVVHNTSTFQNDITLNLATTGVSAGTYGGSSSIPQIVVNAEGQITSASNVGITSGVSSVTGTGTVSCSPTTGAVSCSGPSVTGTGFWWANAGALNSASVILGGDLSQFPLSGSQVDEEVVGVLHKALPALPATDQYLHFTGTGAGNAWAFSAVTAGVSSVTGAGSTSCSPTTGAVTCTTSNTVGNGLTGQTLFANHSVLLGAGTSAINAVGPSSSTGAPIVSTGSGSDPAFQALNLSSANAVTSTLGHGNGGTDVTSPGAANNVLVSNGTNWTSGTAFAGNIARLISGQFTGSATLSTGLTQLASITLTTGSDVFIMAKFEFVSNDTVNNTAFYGISVNVNTSITFVSTGNVPNGTVLGATSVFDYTRMLRISGLSAGSNTFYFLAQLNTGVGTSAPGGSVEGAVFY